MSPRRHFRINQFLLIWSSWYSSRIQCLTSLHWAWALIHRISTYWCILLLILRWSLAWAIKTHISNSIYRIQMFVDSELLSSTHCIFTDRILISSPWTWVGSMWRHHILLVGSIIDINRPLLNSTFLEGLSLFLQSLGMLLISLNQLNLFLWSFIWIVIWIRADIRLVLLIL